MNMKVWSNRKRPVRLFETDLNSITTNFCTEARHQKCVTQNICRAEEPQCEADKCRTAGMSHGKFITVELDGKIDEIIANRMKRDARVAKALAARLRACKPYKLTWEPAGGIKRATVRPKPVK